MKKEGYSRPGFFGTINHYDASGKKVGESRPGFFGAHGDAGKHPGGIHTSRRSTGPVLRKHTDASPACGPGRTCLLHSPGGLCASGNGGRRLFPGSDLRAAHGGLPPCHSHRRLRGTDHPGGCGALRLLRDTAGGRVDLKRAKGARLHVCSRS